MLVVTHELGFARSVSDEIIFMEHGEIIEQGPPEQIFNNPSITRTGDFLGNITTMYNGDGG